MSISEIFFWPVFDSPFFSSPVIAATVVFFASIPSTIHFYKQRQRKANDAISLIYQYAKGAKEMTAQWLEGFDDIMKNIKDGAPYGEPEKKLHAVDLLCGLSQFVI